MLSSHSTVPVPQGDNPHPGQEARNIWTPLSSGWKESENAEQYFVPLKSRPVLRACWLTQASPLLHLEGHFQLTETWDHKSQWPKQVKSQPSDQSFLLGGRFSCV